MDIRRIGFLLSRFQNIVDEEISLLDEKGYIIDSTNVEKVGEYDTSLKENKINDEVLSIEDRLYYLINTDYGKNLIISIKGNTTENRRLLQVIGLFLSENLNNLTKEEFIKGIILKEFDEEEIKEICIRFDMRYDLKTRAIVIKLSEDIINDVESIITNIHPDEVLIRINSNTLAFIRVVNSDMEDEEFGQSIYDTIFSELLYEPIIGVGTIAHNLSYLYESYQKAKLMIKLGNSFIDYRKVYNYNDLLLPILIDKLDASTLKDISICSNCNLQEIIADNELHLTAIKFLENNLNISDSARKLYIHRNTLIYRLNKIQNITGLDLRTFKDAVTFSILMTVIKFLQKNS
ncbi:PucR family transcriptional regulator [Paramaledivibacter caminithermalis]|jgi:carbohydrate diacid regulator|uniref:Carbohydrate diacid regulator n=1 Tax=Paramaledivibacter caminithermalis (strain DSM 15212 / CIP 107654 / DViRD3) TaxID=1121301 RepID=A0A1M6R8J2_PARC5|nr:helix-turn-helix domain-containing protein [Paramaledivibacter caminithermalis]SHK28781.1 carbohydrate diacid regulator [Paramaledivibacter caminithermalis DSM 15212]